MMSQNSSLLLGDPQGLAEPGLTVGAGRARREGGRGMRCHGGGEACRGGRRGDHLSGDHLSGEAPVQLTISPFGSRDNRRPAGPVFGRKL